MAAIVIGFSKTGVPGAGILMVPMMASVFGGRLSVGATLPLLVVGDIFAVYYYHAHAEWARLKSLVPWVVPGILIGAAFLKYAGEKHAVRDPMNPILGAMVLALLALSLLRGRLGEKFAPQSKVGTALTGSAAGFTTMVSNAAGPIMAIYLTSLGLSKEKLMGTTAWYFFMFNLSKIPLLVWLTLDNRKAPLLSQTTLTFDALMIPVVVGGALFGKWVLPKINQKSFSAILLALAALAAVKLILS